MALSPAPAATALVATSEDNDLSKLGAELEMMFEKMMEGPADRLVQNGCLYGYKC